MPRDRTGATPTARAAALRTCGSGSSSSFASSSCIARSSTAGRTAAAFFEPRPKDDAGQPRRLSGRPGRSHRERRDLEGPEGVDRGDVEPDRIDPLVLRQFDELRHDGLVSLIDQQPLSGACARKGCRSSRASTSWALRRRGDRSSWPARPRPRRCGRSGRAFCRAAAFRSAPPLPPLNPSGIGLC